MYETRSPLVDSFFVCRSNEERNAYFRIRNQAELARIYPLIAEDDRLTITDLLTIEQPHHTAICYCLCGNPSLGINRTERTFLLEPTGDPVEYPIANSGGKRRFAWLRGRQQVPANRAIDLLFSHGPTSNMRTHKGKIREVFPSELQEPEVEETAVEPVQPKRPRQPHLQVSSVSGVKVQRFKKD